MKMKRTYFHQSMKTIVAIALNMALVERFRFTKNTKPSWRNLDSCVNGIIWQIWWPPFWCSVRLEYKQQTPFMVVEIQCWLGGTWQNSFEQLEIEIWIKFGLEFNLKLTEFGLKCNFDLFQSSSDCPLSKLEWIFKTPDRSLTEKLIKIERD